MKVLHSNFAGPLEKEELQPRRKMEFKAHEYDSAPRPYGNLFQVTKEKEAPSYRHPGKPTADWLWAEKFQMWKMEVIRYENKVM